jgi:hypothetical protein
MKNTKPYFRELPQSEIDKMIEEGRTVGYCMEHYLQPDWCGYPEALSMELGCWDLCDISINGKRTQISEEYCKSCEFKTKIK